MGQDAAANGLEQEGESTPSSLPMGATLAVAAAPHRPLPTDSPACAQLRANRGGSRVLVVDDNPVNLEVAAEVLRCANLSVDIAGDGAEAVSMAQATRYDLILMDIQMPVVDGLQASRMLRSNPATQVVPIVALTASGGLDEDRAACFAAGMNDYIAKPFDLNTLYLKLLHWLPEARRHGRPTGFG